MVLGLPRGRRLRPRLGDAGHEATLRNHPTTSLKPLAFGRMSWSIVHSSAGLSGRHNPFCAYNDAYSCPLPPVENWLQVPIRAGERDYSG